MGQTQAQAQISKDDVGVIVINWIDGGKTFVYVQKSNGLIVGCDSHYSLDDDSKICDYAEAGE